MSGVKKISRKKAIRLKCLDCCCGNAYEVRKCEIRTCPLWRFRLLEENTPKKEGVSGKNSLDVSQPTPGEKKP